MSDSYRTPIVSLLGHVDHGKTTILDSLSNKSMRDKESGGITQSVRIIQLSSQEIDNICKDVNGFNYELPGLLFVDTPGHRAFQQSRKRGSTMSDIAILVIDIKDGFQPQTHEAVEYLKNTKTPFIVAVNKIDALPEWESSDFGLVAETFKNQSKRSKNRVNDAVYKVAGELSDHDLSSDYYWNIDDFTRNVGIVPISAKTKEGLPDMISIISGLSEKYLRNHMSINVSGDPYGQIVRTDNVRGIGDVIDVLLEDGVIKKEQEIHVGTRNGAKKMEIDRILELEDNEISEDTDFTETDEARAASILRIAGENAERAISGSPIRSKKDDLEEWDIVDLDTSDDGIIIKSPSVDSLKAIMYELRNENIPIMDAGVGPVRKIDVIRSQATNSNENKVIASFSTDIHKQASKEARDEGVEIVQSDIIYELVEEVEKVRSEKKEDIEVTRPCKLRIVDNGIIKTGDPSIIGVEIEDGIIKTGARISRFNNRSEHVLGDVRRIEHNYEATDEAKKGDKVSLSVSKNSKRNNFREGEILYTDLSRREVEVLEKEESITESENRALEEYISNKSDRNEFWY